MTAELITAAEKLVEAITHDNSGTMGRGGNGGLISRDTMRLADETRVAIHQARAADAQRKTGQIATGHGAGDPPPQKK
jgi:hypothetical protein